MRRSAIMISLLTAMLSVSSARAGVAPLEDTASGQMLRAVVRWIPPDPEGDAPAEGFKSAGKAVVATPALLVLVLGPATGIESAVRSVAELF